MRILPMVLPRGALRVKRSVAAPSKEPTMASRLTFEDATQVWLMRWAGMYQHDIAAHFGVNQGRICEILRGETHPGSEAAARNVA